MLYNITLNNRYITAASAVPRTSEDGETEFGKRHIDKHGVSKSVRTATFCHTENVIVFHQTRC